jgi:hypothetical protein
MNACLIACAVAVASTIPCRAAVAQEVAAGRSIALGIMAGGENVTGAFRGAFKPGVVLGAAVQFPLSVRRLAVRADVTYHLIHDNHYACNEIGCADQFTFSHLVTGSFDVVARLNVPATRWSPYVVVGGAVNLTGNSDERMASFNPNHLGLQGGIGFEARPRKSTMFVEMRYMDVRPGGVIPVTIGLRF